MEPKKRRGPPAQLRPGWYESGTRQRRKDDPPYTLEVRRPKSGGIVHAYLYIDLDFEDPLWRGPRSEYTRWEDAEQAVEEIAALARSNAERDRKEAEERRAEEARRAAEPPEPPKPKFSETFRAMLAAQKNAVQSSQDADHDVAE